MKTVAPYSLHPRSFSCFFLKKSQQTLLFVVLHPHTQSAPHPPSSPFPSRRLTWVPVPVPVGAVSIAVAATTRGAAVHGVGRLLRRPVADGQGVPDLRRRLQNEQLGGIVLGEDNDDDDNKRDNCLWTSPQTVEFIITYSITKRGEREEFGCFIREKALSSLTVIATSVVFIGSRVSFKYPCPSVGMHPKLQLSLIHI